MKILKMCISFQINVLNLHNNKAYHEHDTQMFQPHTGSSLHTLSLQYQGRHLVQHHIYLPKTVKAQPHLTVFLFYVFET